MLGINAIYFYLLISFSLMTEFAKAETRAPEPEQFPVDNTPGFSFMRALSELGWHDLNNETWNLYGQGTYISQWKPAFPAAYTNLNGANHSLLPQAENSFSATATFYAGLRLWRGAEFYGAPEMISEDPLSNLKGLAGAIQDFEFQKSGTVSSTWYRSRLNLRQTINFGGEETITESAPMQLGGSTLASRRLVITAGEVSILDIFDKNTFSADLRQQFFNMSFMTHAAYDFVADSRGYTIGLASELYYDHWALRFGRYIPPINPNDLGLDFRFYKYYGDQVELEYQGNLLWGQHGAVRLLGYHNHEKTGSYTDAINAYLTDPAKNAADCIGYNYASNNSHAPDLCWVRKPNDKFGMGINIEQNVNQDIGLFFRAMYSDGRTEVYNYTSTDQSMSMGAVFHGRLWQRHKDAFGVGYAINMLSAAHIRYMQMGGLDVFIGDGALNYSPEQVFDMYYKFNLISSAWATADYQFIANPAYNADRGPVNVLGLRLHIEF